MKILTTTLWLFIFGLFLSSDSTISQKRIIDDTIKEPATETPVVFYSSTDSQLKELSSRIKLSRCRLLILTNQMTIDSLTKESHTVPLRKDSLNKHKHE